MPISSMADLGAEPIERKKQPTSEPTGSMADLGAEEITKTNPEIARAAALREASPMEQRRIHFGENVPAEREATATAAPYQGVIPYLGKVGEAEAKSILPQTVGMAQQFVEAAKNLGSVEGAKKTLGDLWEGVRQTFQGVTSGEPERVGESLIPAVGMIEQAGSLGAKAAAPAVSAGVKAGRFALEHPEATGKAAGIAVGEEIGRHVAGPSGVIPGAYVGEKLGAYAGKILAKPEVKQRLSKVLDWLTPEKKEAITRAYSSPVAEKFAPETVTETKLSEVLEAPKAEDIYTQAGLTPEEIETQRQKLLTGQRKGIKNLEGVHPSTAGDIKSQIAADEAQQPVGKKLVDVDSPEFAKRLSERGGLIIKKRPTYNLIFADERMADKIDQGLGDHRSHFLGLTLLPFADKAGNFENPQAPIHGLNKLNLLPKLDPTVPVVYLRVGRKYPSWPIVTETSPGGYNTTMVPSPKVSETFGHERGGHLSRFEAMREAGQPYTLTTSWLNRDDFNTAYGEEGKALLDTATRAKGNYKTNEMIEEVFSDLVGGRADTVNLTKNEGAQLLTYMADYITYNYGEGVAAKMFKEAAPGLKGRSAPSYRTSVAKPTILRSTLEEAFPRRPVNEATRPVIETIEKQGGITLNPHTLQPRDYNEGYQVSIAGHETPIPRKQALAKGRMTLQAFQDLAKENKGDIGAWVEGDNQVWDVSKHHATLEDAVNSAIANKQRAIWDWKEKRNIPIEEARKMVGNPAEIAMEGFRKQEVNPPVKTLNEETAKARAAEHETATHAPESPAVKKSYETFKKETLDQFNALKDAGLQMEPWTEKGQPYANSKEMMKDVKENKHLYFFTGGDLPKNHPLAEITPGTNLTYNDVFRAVHDAVGHSIKDYQFGPIGEENAYREHRQYYSKEALPALTAETRMQNSWVNFGKHLEREGNIPKKGEPGYVPLGKRPFSEQKAYTPSSESTKLASMSKQDVLNAWESEVPFARKEKYMIKTEEGVSGKGWQETGAHPSNIEGLSQVPGSLHDIEKAFKTKKGPIWNKIEQAAQEQADTWNPAMLASKDTPGGMAEATEPTWYGTANARMKEIAKDAGLPVKTIAGATAALSPNNAWSNNVRDIKKWVAAHKMGELKPDTSAGTYPKNREKAYRIMQGEDPDKVLNGPKVRAFYKALMGKGTDPVIDFHMANILRGHGYKTMEETTGPSPKEYKELAEKLKKEATAAGMSPSDYQAMRWIQHREGAQRNLFPEKGGTE